MTQKQFNNMVRFLLILILVWDLLITSYLIFQHNQKIENELNRAICIEELIPIDDVED